MYNISDLQEKYIHPVQESPLYLSFNKVMSLRIKINNPSKCFYILSFTSYITVSFATVLPASVFEITCPSSSISSSLYNLESSDTLLLFEKIK